jgi:hypothetical protein
VKTVMLACFAIFASACAARPVERVVASPSAPLAPLGILAEDTAPKQDLRMVPPEVYMRTYLVIFGSLAPLEAQTAARGGDGNGLFDTWDDYVSALGFPDYRQDIPRQTQTNALMVATFERLGVALCDRAVDHDLGASTPLSQRVIFKFDDPPGMVDAKLFSARFDVLHRTFLGYPAALAPSERTTRFYSLFRAIAAGHKKADPKSRLSPNEAGWAAVCYGLIRHPEFHLY